MVEYIDPILITGAARSGTSMIAGIISMSGAWGGKFRPPTPNNKKGMFENAEIISTHVKPLLKKQGYDPMGQKPLPKIADYIGMTEAEVTMFKNSIIWTIKRQRYNGGIWFYKGAKMCLMWPLWYRCFPRAKWIIVRRDVEDIVRSCLRTSFMRNRKSRAEWLEWVAEHEKRFEEMQANGLTMYEVWPQKAVDGDFSELQNLVKKLELEWNENLVRDFITPALWHKKSGGS